ncbi:MAG TPA: class I SAM-dependent methyltransferase [Nitrospira sp.]|nr:class I SAM-dependent methyltransferase [Nitrospira sp.]
MSLCNEVVINRFLERELNSIPAHHRGVLLDLGCGTQPYRSLYEQRFKQVIACDVELRSPLDVRLDVRRLPFRDGTVDVVLLTEVIEHLVEGAGVIGEIGRVLKPGGRLLITWPFIYPLHELPHDYLRYSEFAMQSLAAGGGLAITRLERRGDLLCVAGTLVEQFVLGSIELAIRCPWVGPLLSPVRNLLYRTCRWLWMTYLRMTAGAARLHPCAPGTDVKGVVNHLALWTMGYCACATKSGFRR